MSLRKAASSRFIRVGIGIDIGIPIPDPDIIWNDAVLPMMQNWNFKYFDQALLREAEERGQEEL
jgi:hypothetical protein